MQLPCAGQGRQPLPSRSDACVTSYWVLPDAGIGRIGSKAAFLPSSVLGENEGKCLSTASGGAGISHWRDTGKKGEDCDDLLLFVGIFRF